MILLTIVSGIAVLLSSILLYNKELNDAMYIKIDIAQNVVEEDITELLSKAGIIADSMRFHQNMSEALSNGDRERVALIANSLRDMAQLDFCTIVDKNGIVFTRVHDPDNYGDDFSELPHIKSALEGSVESIILRGVTIRIGVMAGAPVYDNEGNVVGAVSLGFRLDSQEFVDRIKRISGAEVSVFFNNERIATTSQGENGAFALGDELSSEVNEKILAREYYTTNIHSRGNNAVARYIPIYGSDDNIAGIISVGLFTADETGKIFVFLISGVLITLLILLGCVFLASYISGFIENRVNGMMKVIQQKLEHESFSLKAMFDSIPDHIFFKDTKFKYTRANKSLLEFHNIKENDLIGNDDLNGLGVPQEVADEFRVTDQIVLSEKKVIRADESVPDSDGNLLVFETSKIPLLQNGKAIGILGIAHDITERKIMEEAAQSASRSKSAFLANMSHEIRTPMNSIIGFTELAQNFDIPSKAREYLDNIQDSAKWLLSIVNDILDISKIESGSFNLDKIPFSLQGIFSYCQSVMLPKAKEKGVTLYCYAEPIIGKSPIGDAVRLRQVIMNLVSNAVKFTDTGSIKLLASITEQNDNEAKIHFEIKDSGIGMNTAQVKRIFDPFKQADESISRKYGGTGLGLTISRNIIEMMGGILKVDSEYGKGSMFTFDITFDLINDTSESMSESITESNFEKPMFKGEVLICEDNNLNQKVISDHLERVGLKAVIANDGKEGVNAVIERTNKNEEPFDLIFMDIHMPVMDGLEAATLITELDVKTPIVALTANIMSNDMDQYKQSGMVDTLGKPFTTNELWRCLIKYIPVQEYTSVNEKQQTEEERIIKQKLKINFVKDNQETYANFIKALESKDIKTAHRIAHSLKSNAAQIDAKRLSDAAAAAEKVLKEGKRLTEVCKKKIKAELEMLLDELSYLLNEDENTVVPDITDKNKIRELFEKLEPYLRDKNAGCLGFIEDLRAVPGADELVYQIEEFNFNLALKELEHLKEAGIGE